MSDLRSLFTFLRILDDEGKLSLTNIALILCLVKFAVAKNASVTELGAFFVSVLGYNAKKFIEAPAKVVEVIQ